jgi:hypothetical protein
MEIVTLGVASSSPEDLHSGAEGGPVFCSASTYLHGEIVPLSIYQHGVTTLGLRVPRP